MDKNKQKRARTESDKMARSEAIIDAASDLFDKNDYHQITMAIIAREAGVAKGTVFNYFSTKEELFLSLTGKYFTLFFEKLTEILNRSGISVDRTPENLSVAIYEALDSQPQLLRIVVLLSGIIEKNVTYESLNKFKKALLRQIFSIGLLLEQHYRFIPSGSGKQLLMWSYGILIGFQTLANPEDIAQDIIEKENMELFSFDFKQEFTQLIKMIALGYSKEEL